MMKLFPAVLLCWLCITLCAQMPVDQFNRLWDVPLLGNENNRWDFPSCRERLRKANIKLQPSPGRHSAFLHNKKLLGNHCQELVIITDRDNKNIEAIELIFANKGDVTKRAKVQIRRNDKNLSRKLTSAFGEPKKIRIGSGSKKQQNNAELWQCSYARIILDTEKGEYCIITIKPPESKSKKHDNRIDARALQKNVKRNKFGDVFISGIPMVNQGFKGYCAVATAARVMLYFGIKDLNQHQLADDAGSDSKDGTNMGKLLNALRPTLHQYNLKKSGSHKLDMKFITRYIDAGVPVFWVMYSTKYYNKKRQSNARARTKAASPEEWRKKLKRQKKIKQSTEGPHLCLIIGYNEKTDEIAVSNSWGEHENTPSWISMTDAGIVHRNCLVIHP